MTQSKVVVKAEYMIPCKWCGEKIKKGTITCMHCGQAQFADDISD